MKRENGVPHIITNENVGMRTKIYVLRDEFQNVRYVGRAKRPLDVRLKTHIAESRKGVLTHKCCWIRSMLRLGLCPTIDLIQEVSGDGGKEEISYISAFRRQGIDLTNGTDGGDGNINPTAETRKKMSERRLGIRLSEETKRRIGESRLGIRRSVETRKRMSDSTKGHPGYFKGGHHSEEAKKKISVSLKGKPR